MQIFVCPVYVRYFHPPCQFQAGRPGLADLDLDPGSTIESIIPNYGLYIPNWGLYIPDWGDCYKM